MKLILSKSVATAVFAAMIFDCEVFYAISYAAVIIHELSHLSACLILGVRPVSLTLSVFGMELKTERIGNESHKAIISSVGPLTSIFIFLICVIWRKIFHKPPAIFEISNLCIGIVNLIPTMPLDGGCILKSLLSSRNGILRANRTMVKTGNAITIIMMIVCITNFLTEKFNISVLMFVIFLIYSRKNLRKLSLWEKKLVLSGEIKNNGKPRYISVDINCELMSVVEKISPSYFLIANVFENGRFKGEITQTHIIQYVSEHGITGFNQVNFDQK